jgi:hypothetical protein
MTSNGGEVRNTARDRSGVPFDDDRERIARGRPAAEAVFRNRPVTEASVVETPVCSEHSITHEIQASQFGRVRAWAKYGMTVHQIAQTCGVAVGDIERILRKSRQ